MTWQTIRLEFDARNVATLTLAQPEKHNAMSASMIAELAEAADALAARTDVRAVVLASEGKSFCAGGDLAWMRQQFEADRETRVKEALKLAGMLRKLNELPQLLIGRIQGQAFGGGIGLISVCDVAVGVEDARFALTETRLGLIPATIGPYVLARLGEGVARRIFMSGRRFDGNEAVRLGLLSRAVAHNELDQAVADEIEPCLATAPGAVARAKQLARSLGPSITDEVMLDTANRLADCWESPEAQEGIAAFFDKRKPSWQN